MSIERMRVDRPQKKNETSCRNRHSETFLRKSSRAYLFGSRSSWQSFKSEVSFSTVEVSVLPFLRLWQVKVQSLAAPFKLVNSKKADKGIFFSWPLFQIRNWVYYKNWVVHLQQKSPRKFFVISHLQQLKMIVTHCILATLLSMVCKYTWLLSSVKHVYKILKLELVNLFVLACPSVKSYSLTICMFI